MRRDHDARLRSVEVAVSSQKATLDAILGGQSAMETRIMAHIEQIRPGKPDKPWAAISANASLVVALLAFVAAFYNR